MVVKWKYKLMKGGVTVSCQKLEGKLKDKIKAEYILGGTTYKKLADKYNVAKGTIEKTASPQCENWKRLKKEASEKAAEKVVKKTAAQKSECAMLIDKTNAQIVSMLSKAIADNTATSEFVKMLNDAVDTLKKCKQVGGFKSEEEIKEQLARIENLRAMTKVNQAKLTTDEKDTRGIQLIINR